MQFCRAPWDIVWKKKQEKLLVPVEKGEMLAGAKKVSVESRERLDFPRESLPSKDSRAAFHAHFINSNLSPAENWIRLIPAIDAALRSRIL